MAVIPKSLFFFFFCEYEIWHFSHIENSLFQIPCGLWRYKNVQSNHFKADVPTWEKHPRTLWCTLPVSHFAKCTNVWRPRSSQNPETWQDSHVVWKLAWKEQCGSPGDSVVNPIKLKPGHLHGRRCCFTTLGGNQTACRHSRNKQKQECRRRMKKRRNNESRLSQQKPFIYLFFFVCLFF